MNLNKITFLLILGSVYTICHKAIFAIFPNLPLNPVANNIFSFLWILATFTIILFAYYFLREVKPLKKSIKISLQLVILFTSIIIFLEFPFVQTRIPGIIRNTIFEFARFLNSITILVFWISFYKIVSPKYSLHSSLKLIIIISVVGLLLGLIPLSYYMHYIINGEVSVPFAPLQIVGVIVFLISYYALINFLIKFNRIDDYTKLFC